jgi:outer membrane protein TolC
MKLEGEYTQSKGSLFGGGSTVGSVDLGLELNWSIYEGGVRRSQMRVAQHQAEIAKRRIEQTRDAARGRFVALMKALEKARAMVETAGREQSISTERVLAAEESLAAGAGSREAVLEAGLRRDIARIAGSTARMRAAQIQAEIYALFGALDTDALSRDFAGG